MKFQVNPLRKIKVKKLKCRLLQFLFGALRVTAGRHAQLGHLARQLGW